MRLKRNLKSHSSSDTVLNAVRFQTYLEIATLALIVALDFPRTILARIPKFHSQIALQDHACMALDLPGMTSTAGRPRHGSPNRRLSLAQTRNLVPGARKHVSQAEWTSVIHRYKSRTHSSMECPICCEPFRQKGSQVLLSCSHSFHQHCLSTFERLTHGCGQSCPVCRSQNYEKKMINDGHEQFLNSCASVIQSNWRRCQAVERFQTLWERAPAPAPGDLREKWALNRLGKRSDKLFRAMDNEVGDLDDFFRELERQTEQAVAPSSDCTQMEMARKRATAEEEENETGGGGGVDWNTVLRTANLRGLEECSICMMPLHKRSRTSSQCSLLSCSHCFHKQCIASFERFQTDRGLKKTCPVCREHYQRRQLKQQKQPSAGALVTKRDLLSYESFL